MSEEKIAENPANNPASKTAKKPRKEGKYASLSDIITFQAIICVVTAIMFVVINTFYPEISADMYAVYMRLAGEESGGISEFLHSTPNKNL